MKIINAKNLKLVFLTFAVCLAGLSLSNMTTYARSEKNVEDIIFQRVVEADAKGNLEKAKDDIQRVLKLNPKHSGATFYAGKYSYYSGNHRNAEKFMSRLVNDPVYGAEANSILADIKMNKQQGRNSASVKVLIAGGAYLPALQLCEEFLSGMPNSPDVLFSAAVMECILNNRDKAEAYALRYHNIKSDENGKELNLLIDGWFAPESNYSEAVDKLLSIKNRELMLPPVRAKLREMIISLGNVEKFEKYIAKERAIPGADSGSLDRDLIQFFIDNKRYDKAIEKLEQRPLDSLDDNLLYVDILMKTGQIEKALENSGYLIDVHKSDMRCYFAWINAWNAYVNKTRTLPGRGNAILKKKYNDYANVVLTTVKPEPLVTDNPSELIKLFRIAMLTKNFQYENELKKHVCSINFNTELAQEIINLSYELKSIKKTETSMDLLQSAWNSMPDNYAIPLKMAELTMDTDPEAAAKVLDVVMAERPNHNKALMIWLDCMSRLGRPEDAAKRIDERLKDPELDETTRKQLNSKLELLSLEGVDISKYGDSKSDAEILEMMEGKSSSSSSGKSGSLSEYEAPH